MPVLYASSVRCISSLVFARDFLAARLEHEVEPAAADDFADRALADLAERLLRVAHVERVRDGLRAPVLHGEIDVDEVLVGGEHAGLVAEALDRLDVDDLPRLDRPRDVPAQPGLGGRDVLAEARDDTALGGVDHVRPRQRPDRRAAPARWC